MSFKRDNKVIISLSEYEELKELSKIDKVNELIEDLKYSKRELLHITFERDDIKLRNKYLENTIDKIKNSRIYKICKFLNIWKINL